MIKLKKLVACALLSACVAGSVGVVSACGSGVDYSEDFTKLQQEIENLKNENNSLKDQISSITPSDKDYTQEIERLQQQLESLKSENSSNITEIEKLQQQIEAQKKLIESLQNSSDSQLKTYKIGDTFTYSYQGVEYFSLTLENRSTLIIKNLKMIDFIPRNIITFKIRTPGGWGTTTMPSRKIDIDKIYTIKTIALSDEALEYVFGYPLGEDGILPYAIFDLTVSA